MFRDSKKRNYVIKIVERCVIGTFIFMMGLFAIYGFRSINPQELLQEQIVQTLLFNHSQTEDVAVESDVSVEEHEAIDESKEAMVVEELEDEAKENKKDDKDIQILEDEVIDIDVVPTNQQIAHVEKSPTIEVTAHEVIVPIKDKSIDESDEVLNHLQDIIQTGQENVMALAMDYINELDVAQRMELINLSLEKIQYIDVQQVWGWVEDGISQQDIQELQKVMEEHFTVEEIDLLYQHYRQYAAAL